MKNNNKNVRDSQVAIFRDLYEEHKGSPMAVSSESWQHKELRFSQIAKIFEDENEVEVHDVGMGLASFYEYLTQSFSEKRIIYSGTEILPEYIEESKRKFPECTFHLRDLAEKPGKDMHDYMILSGVFHQKRDTSIPLWEDFYQSLLRNSFDMCKKGIAFNFVSPFVDFYQKDVYYCNLPKLLNFINDEMSRFFVINHNYALFEFTVFVFKEDFIREKYQQAPFQKYFKRNK